jgi:hypothetical protein
MGIVNMNEKERHEFIKKIMASPEIANEMEKTHPGIKAEMAGYLMSSWLPHSTVRKVIMLGIFLVGIIGAFHRKNYAYILFLVPLFSPRAVGELTFFLGNFRQRK